MPSLLPQLRTSTKSVFICELLVAENVDVEKICNWLRKHQASEISFSENNSDSGKFWSISFCTENEKLVAQLQDRCREKVHENLKQKDQRIEEFTRQVKELYQNLQNLQLVLENRDRNLTFFKYERERLKIENNRLKQLESDHKTLQRAYQTQNEKLATIENTLKSLQSKKSEINGARNESGKDFNSNRDLGVEVCRFCGKPAMPGQGICLNCAR